MKYELVGVPHYHVDEIWDYVQYLVIEALEFGDNKFLAEDIYLSIKKREMQLWLILDKDEIIKGVLVTEILLYPRKKILLIVLLSGVEFKEWEHLFSQLKKFALQHHCQNIEFYGRKGWKKLMKKYGFEMIYECCSMSLKGDLH